MSNFTFLKTEWPDLRESAVKAEVLAYSDARSACFYARRALELAVHWLYKYDRRAANTPARFADSSPVEAPPRFLRGAIGGPQAGHWYANFPVFRSSRRECNTGRLYYVGKVGIVFSWLFLTAMNLGQLISTPVGS